MDENKIRSLANIRLSKQSLNDALKMMVSGITDSPEYKEIEKALQASTETESAILHEIVDSALIEFRTTGNKHIHEVVTVKEFNLITLVNEDELREWLLDNFTPALVVDDKIVKDEAKKGNLPARFFTKESEARVQLSANLSAYQDAVT
jgi:hypothetical protein